MKLQRFGFSFRALGGGNELQLYARSETEAVTVAEKLLLRVQALEQKYSRYRSDSVISKINAAAGQNPIEVDEETADLIDFAALCHQRSGGLFDLTSGVLRRAWDFKEKAVPTLEDLSVILLKVGWDKVTWHRPYFSLAVPGMEIDFGGIGKEYATDLLAEMCKEHGIEHALVNLGGDLRAVGPHPDGTPWRLGVRHPRIPKRTLRIFEISQGSLATSGDYERFMEIEGKRYCHILNPRTGFPTIESRSVSVIAPNCLFAGSLSTISMLMQPEAARQLLNQQGVNYYMVDGYGQCWDHNGSVGTSSDFTKSNEAHAY